MTAAEPAVKTASAYYEANIGSVKSISDLVGNYRLLSYALNAYGLGEQINAKGLITKVLEGGVSNPRSLANTLPNAQWKAFAAAFNFVDSGATPPSSTSTVTTTTGDYVEQQLESDQGEQDVGVQLALYFQRVAPTVTSEIGILADPNLLQVAATIMGLPPAAAADLQPKTLSELMPLSDLKDPAKLTQLTERFTAMYDYTYGPSSGATSNLTVDFGQFELGAIGRGHHPRRRNQFERFGAGQRAQRFHWLNTANLLDRSDVEHVEAHSGRVSPSPGLHCVRKVHASAAL